MTLTSRIKKQKWDTERKGKERQNGIESDAKEVTGVREKRKEKKKRQKKIGPLNLPPPCGWVYPPATHSAR